MITTVSIVEPIWSSKSVGIALRRLTDDIIVEILYEDAKGVRTYPGRYFMRREKAIAYPIQNVSGVDLVIIPIADFQIASESQSKEPVSSPEIARQEIAKCRAILERRGRNDKDKADSVHKN